MPWIESYIEKPEPTIKNRPVLPNTKVPVCTPGSPKSFPCLSNKIGGKMKISKSTILRHSP